MTILIISQLTFSIVFAVQQVQLIDVSYDQYKQRPAYILLAYPSIQAVLTLALITMLFIENGIIHRIVPISDPFSDAQLLSVLLFFNYVQRLLFRLYLLARLGDVESTNFDFHSSMMELTKLRTTMQQLEMLFFVVPFAQNLQKSSL